MSLLATLALFAVAPVQDPATGFYENTPDGRPRIVIEAYSLFATAQNEGERIASVARADMARIDREEDPEGYAAARAKYQRARDQVAGAQMAFVQEFAKRDWKVWRSPQDDKLLEAGLSGTGERYLNEDPALAAAAMELLLEKFPETASGPRVRFYTLPVAWLNQGDPELAVQKINAAVQADPKDAPYLMVYLADAHALRGDFKAARAACEQALAGLSDEALAASGASETLKRQAANVVSDAEMRLALLGKPVPEIANKAYVGMQPAVPLTKVLNRGGVTVLDFWATWCGPCRTVMPQIDDFFQAHKEEGLLVIGVTRFYDTGFLPEMREAIHAGERVEGMDEQAFYNHLADFKSNTQIGYPFLVSDREGFDALKIRGIPSVFVVGKDGRIRFIVVGSGKHSTLEYAVKSALAEPGPEEAAAGK